MSEVRIKISGLNLSRLLDKLVQENVCVTEIVTKKNCVKFNIPENKLKVLDKICKIEHKFYIIINKSGIKYFFSRLPYYFGTIFAILIIYCYMFSVSFIVFNVNVSYFSETNYDLSKVMSVLNENGITSGMTKNKFSSNQIEKLLLLNVDDIEGCSVEFLGGNLNINIYPAVKQYEIEKGDLISKFYGIITHAEAFSGNLKVKVGDIVNEGDVLIENNNGASGKIQAKVYFTGSQIYNENQQEIFYTGNIFTKKDYSIFGKYLSIDKKQCTFSQFLTKNCSFYITKNYFLPIKCDETVYFEIKILNRVVPFEVNEEKIKKSTYDEAYSKIPYGTEILGTNYSVVKELNYTRVDCFIETIINLV